MLNNSDCLLIVTCEYHITPISGQIIIIETILVIPSTQYIYKIMSPVVFYIENNRGLAVAWKYKMRLAEVHIFDMAHNMGDMNFFLSLI